MNSVCASGSVADRVILLKQNSKLDKVWFVTVMPMCIKSYKFWLYIEVWLANSKMEVQKGLF